MATQDINLIVTIPFLGIMLLGLGFMVHDGWTQWYALEKSFYPLSVLLIVAELIGVVVLMHGVLTGMSDAHMLLGMVFFFLGAVAWSVAIRPYLEKTEGSMIYRDYKPPSRKSKSKADASKAVKPIDPDKPYILGDDGEIIEVVDEEKRKR